MVLGGQGFGLESDFPSGTGPRGEPTRNSRNTIPFIRSVFPVYGALRDVLQGRPERMYSGDLGRLSASVVRLHPSVPGPLRPHSRLTPVSQADPPTSSSPLPATTADVSLHSHKSRWLDTGPFTNSSIYDTRHIKWCQLFCFVSSSTYTPGACGPRRSGGRENLGSGLCLSVRVCTDRDVVAGTQYPVKGIFGDTGPRCSESVYLSVCLRRDPSRKGRRCRGSESE